jgi:riboflavin kinase/FMN adenylyltransferase
MKFFRRKVKKGIALGRKIGYPTLNFNVGNFGDYYKPGVYKCEITLDNSSYIGALYFGPKLSHKSNVLELHIVNYIGQIYGQFVRFKVGKKIRSPKTFSGLDELKKQIEKDLKKVV